MFDISIIIPFYNENEGISELIDNINSYYKSRNFEFEIIFVNDGSTDNSLSYLYNQNNILFPSKVISLSKNFGSHAAIRGGFLHAKGKFTTYLPADLQISFDAIQNLYDQAKTGYDIAVGIRKTNKMTNVFENFFSHQYADLIKKYVNKDFPYEGIETILISGKVRDHFNLNIESNSSFALQILSMGFKNKFVGIEKTERKKGKSKWTLQKKIKLLIDSFVAFSFAPIRLVSIVGITFFIIGLIWSSYIIIRKLTLNDLTSGWPALYSTLLLGFGITNISLGIIAEYLWRTLDASRKRPVFIIDEIIELKK